uniref:Uncharacterized protein n=1 Tax=Arundo donax TaxID=35708 RepID=A0A0A9A1C6_ARUDO
MFPPNKQNTERALLLTSRFCCVMLFRTDEFCYSTTVTPHNGTHLRTIINDVLRCLHVVRDSM